MTKSNHPKFGMQLLLGSTMLVLAAVAAASMLGSRSVGATPQTVGMESFGPAQSQPVGFKTLYQFTGASNADGAEPMAGVNVDSDGNLFGTTYYGGNAGCYEQRGYPAGCGTAFKLNPTGRKVDVFSFFGSNGQFPLAGLTRDSSGNLYGTTSEGGPSWPNGDGIVFKIGKTGKETVLYSFTGGADGGVPVAGVVLDAEGNLYGTTEYGGSEPCGAYPGCGTVYKLDLANGQETVLYSFTGGMEGNFPASRLVSDTKGNLYGTT
jgi:uncharacterized repeat protein (TIGR03803 family)